MDEMESKRVAHMDTEELRDLLVSIRNDIAKRIRILAGDFRILTRLQERQEKVEARLAELGNSIGAVYSKAKEWKEEEEEE